MNELPKLTEEDINEIVYEYYGFTINEIDHNVGYWCTRFTEERTKRKGLEHNWNELKKYVASQYLRADDESDYETAFLMIEDKMQELEEGGNNETD